MRIREIIVPLILLGLSPGLLRAQYIGQNRAVTQAQIAGMVAARTDTTRFKADSTSKAAQVIALDSRLDSDSLRLDSLATASAAADSIMDAEKVTAEEVGAQISDSLAADTLRNLILLIPAADSSACGVEVRGTAGETISFGMQVYAKSDGKYWLTDADAAATGQGVAVCITKGTTAANNPIKLLTFGFLRCDAWNWTVHGTVYTSTTPGAFQQTAVSGSGDQVQFAGYARTADVIFYNPCPILIEVK